MLVVADEIIVTVEAFGSEYTGRARIGDLVRQAAEEDAADPNSVGSLLDLRRALAEALDRVDRALA